MSITSEARVVIPTSTDSNSIDTTTRTVEHIWKPIIQESDGDHKKDSILFFLNSSNATSIGSSNCVPLIHFVRKYTNIPLSTYVHAVETNDKRETVLQVLLSDLYDVLGMIRSLQYDLQLYNKSIISSLSIGSSNKIRYYQYRFLQQIQMCCPTNISRHIVQNECVSIDGLHELIDYIETYYSTEIHVAHQQVHVEQQIAFTSLMEYCLPGTLLIDTGLITGCNSTTNNTNMTVKCRSCRYRRNKTISGKIVTSFEASIEFIIALGIPPIPTTTTTNHNSRTQPHYAIVETIWMQSEYDNVRSIEYDSNNPYAMLLLPNPTILQELRERGKLYQSFCYPTSSPTNNTSSSSGVYVNYAPGTFYPCSGTLRSRSSSSTTTTGSSSTYQPSRNGGRMMIDIYQSYIRGIHICKPPADSSIASDMILQTFQSYLRFLRKSNQQQPSTVSTSSSTSASKKDEQQQSSPDDFMVLNGSMLASIDDSNIEDDSFSNEMLYMTWPVVCGFSFTTRQWGIVTVDGLSSIQNYSDTVFDTLVLAPSRKRLLRAIVRNYHRSQTLSTTDVVPGKGEGLIILLHGPPGVGKTLTAEAVSEVLHRPLYRVSMGELGTTPDHLEEKLLEIFDLCLPWSAIVLIDEAELLLRTRAISDDLVRNAMVCVMLRLLEYFPGILFLTTNSHIDQLDPAIVSRITVALEYHALDMESRKEIWRNTISRALSLHPKNTASSTTTNNNDDTLVIDENHILSEKSLSILATQYSSLNGRQIKNAVQLASILSQYEQEQEYPDSENRSLRTMITLGCIHEVLDMTVPK